VEYLVEHRLLDIIALTICAVICGADSWVEIEAYGHTKPTGSAAFWRFLAAFRPTTPSAVCLRCWSQCSCKAVLRTGSSRLPS
jgi:hypothetical protein